MKNRGGDIPTMQIRAMIQEAEDTGLVTQEVLDAFEAERVLALERIERLKILHEEEKITYLQMNAQITEIRQSLQARANALGIHAENII